MICRQIDMVREIVSSLRNATTCQKLFCREAFATGGLLRRCSDSSSSDGDEARSQHHSILDIACALSNSGVGSSRQ